jgi:hypothetical protein
MKVFDNENYKTVKKHIYEKTRWKDLPVHRSAKLILQKLRYYKTKAIKRF